MDMAGKRVIIDGVPVDLPDGIVRVSDLRSRSGISSDEQIVQIKGASSKPLDEDDEIQDQAHLVSIPSITKGSA
jgi:hypothetical protein